MARDVWKHMAGHPGYFVTEDGCKQMVMTPRGSFVICETKESAGGGFRVLRGPARDPAKLGIPQALLDEAEKMTVDSLIQKLKAGQNVTVDVSGMAAPARQRRR